jgi:UDP-N-acetylglucosamine 2-epimerase (non-hydrolysing)
MISKPKILLTFGTRPDAVKMAPLVKELENEDSLDSIVAVTAQHREMLDQILNIFQIQPKYDMDIMKNRQTLEDIANAIMSEFPKILDIEKPDLVLVHGDTSTAFLSALVCFYRSIAIGHVEAGLRTANPLLPFPEEMNRRLIDQVASLFFAPTKNARDALLMERNHPADINITGNTVVDALLMVSEMAKEIPLPDYLEEFRKYRMILVTAHRRESWDDGLKRISRALREIVDTIPDTAILFPIHKNPVVREQIQPILGDHPRIKIIEPLDYLAFVQAMMNSYIILTDSGGIQEEAPSLDIPVLVMRDVTERQEGIHAGCIKLIGTFTEGIVEGTLEILAKPEIYQKMSCASNPFGDGLASKRIVRVLKRRFGIPSPSIKEF